MANASGGFRLSTIEVGMRIVAPRSFVVSLRSHVLMCNTVSLYGNVQISKNNPIASFINMTGTAHAVQQRHEGECEKQGSERQRCDEAHVLESQRARHAAHEEHPKQ
ncbi:hypothetical protein P3T22_003456 [Paraburkholderia sp. GAS348]